MFTLRQTQVSISNNTNRNSLVLPRQIIVLIWDSYCTLSTAPSCQWAIFSYQIILSEKNHHPPLHGKFQCSFFTLSEHISSLLIWLLFIIRISEFNTFWLSSRCARGWQNMVSISIECFLRRGPKQVSCWVSTARACSFLRSLMETEPRCWGSPGGRQKRFPSRYVPASLWSEINLANITLASYLLKLIQVGPHVHVKRLTCHLLEKEDLPSEHVRRD